MAGKGWVSLHRELIDKPIWLESTPEQKTILITLLLMANHSSNKWEWKGEQYVVEAGQFITSLPKIAEKCGKGVSVQNVRTALKRFEKYNFLTDESTKQNRLITIVNWAFYQGEEGRANRAPNSQLTDNQQTANSHLTSNNNVNNLDNENNINKYNTRSDNIPSNEGTIPPIPLNDIYRLSNYLSNDVIEVIVFYGEAYKLNIGVDHPRLKIEQLQRIESKKHEVDDYVDDWKRLIVDYFQNEEIGDGNINRLFSGYEGEGVLNRLLVH